MPVDILLFIARNAISEPVKDTQKIAIKTGTTKNNKTREPQTKLPSNNLGLEKGSE